MFTLFRVDLILVWARKFFFPFKIYFALIVWLDSYLFIASILNVPLFISSSYFCVRVFIIYFSYCFSGSFWAWCVLDSLNQWGGSYKEDLQCVLWALLWIWMWDWYGDIQQARRLSLSLKKKKKHIFNYSHLSHVMDIFQA